jgi:hypothetical protein
MNPFGPSRRAALCLCLAAALFGAGRAAADSLAAVDSDGVELVLSIRHPKLLNADVERLMAAIPEAASLRMALMGASVYGYPEFSDIEPGSNVGVAFGDLLGTDRKLPRTGTFIVGFAKLKEGGKIWNLLLSKDLKLRKVGDWTLIAKSADVFARIGKPQGVTALLEKPHPEDVRLWLRTSPVMLEGLRQKALQAFRTQNPGASEADSKEVGAEAEAVKSLLSQVRTVVLDASFGDKALTIRLSAESEPGSPLGRLLSSEPGPSPAVAAFVSGDALMTAFQRFNQKALADYAGYALDTLIAPLDKTRAAKGREAKATLLAALAAADGGAVAVVNLRVNPKAVSPKVTAEYFSVESGHFDRDLERRRIALAQGIERNVVWTPPVMMSSGRAHVETSVAFDATSILGTSFDRMTSVSLIGKTKVSESVRYLGIVGGLGVSASNEETLRARLPALIARRELPDALAAPVVPGEWMRFQLNGDKLVDTTVAVAELDPTDPDVKAAIGQFKAEYDKGGPAVFTICLGDDRAVSSASIPYSFLQATFHMGVYAHGKGLNLETLQGMFTPFGAAGMGLQPRVSTTQRPILPEWVRHSNLASRLLAQGSYADSLREYAWCYDHSGDDGQQGAAAFRADQALRGMARVGAHYPPAFDAIRQRRTGLEQLLTARPGRPDLLVRLIEVNRLLHEPSATLAFYDRLPPDSPVRTTLLPRLFSQFVEAKRYADALKARPYRAFVRQFDQLDELKAQDPESNMIGMLTMRIVTQGPMEAEALAGTGDAATAIRLVERILSLKDTPSVRASLRRHLDRVGHGDWVGKSASPAAATPVP